jgi:sialidase-1
MPSGELVCFLRENSGLGRDAYKAISEDGGETWDGPYRMPIPGCHRPVAGLLDTGEVLVTHRFMQGGSGWLGSWTQNTFAALTDVDSCLARDRNDAWARILPLDYDRSPEADTGYTGWVQFDDGEIFVVNYVVDDAPEAPVREPEDYDGDYDAVQKARIRGYALDRGDFVTDPARLDE